MAKKSTKEDPIMEDPKNMSKEQLGSKRKEITEYYEGNIPHLETQLKYEQLLRDIEKTRAERLQAQMFIAQTMAPPPESESDPEVQREMSKNFNEVKADKELRVNPNTMDGKEVAEKIKRTLKRQSNDV
tara:strand:+ start:278 stop:664 length:387 start_codon:yes stop_codon:yes gene_type:complete